MKMTKHTLTALALALASSAAWGQAAPTVCNIPADPLPTITIAVASNFYEPAITLAGDFAGTPAGAGKTIRVCHNASGTLVQEINEGTSPYSLFLAADSTWPGIVHESLRRGEPFPYAYGIPVLWSYTLSQDALLTADDKVNQTNVTSLAIGDPNVAPYGAAAEVILREMEQWENQPADWIVQHPNIAKTKEAIQAGTQIAGFISKAQICAAGSGGAYVEFTDTVKYDYNLRQDGVSLSVDDTTAAFTAYLGSPEIQSRLASDEFCYASPPSSSSTQSLKRR